MILFVKISKLQVVFFLLEQKHESYPFPSKSIFLSVHKPTLNGKSMHMLCSYSVAFGFLGMEVYGIFLFFFLIQKY